MRERDEKDERESEREKKLKTYILLSL